MAGAANPLRQQMINMMYLVLTALLALNVSADILKAFALVNTSLEGTNTSFQAKNKDLMLAFNDVYNDDKEKAQKVYANARIAVTESDTMFNYLANIKDQLAALSGNWVDSAKTNVVDQGNTEIPANFFLNRKKATEIKGRLEAFETKMKSLLIDQHGKQLPPSTASFEIDTEDPIKVKGGTKKDWEHYYFEGVPVIAAITELTKFQNDVRNAQAEVTNHLFKQVGKTDVKTDMQLAIIRSNTPAVFQGGKYEAEVILGAYSSTQPFTAIVNGQTIPVVNGVGKYTTTASGLGDKDVSVKIQYKDGTGQVVEKTTTTKYQVFTGSATISADAMNMLYIGLENPMSVSVPGFSDAQTIVNFGPGANARKTGPGKYILKPDGSNRLIKVSVAAKMPDGSTKTMGQQEYRVRKVPNPEVLLGLKSGGVISRGELLTVTKVNAGLGEGFAYEGLKFNVTGYTFAISPKAGGNTYFENVNGSNLTGSIRAKLQSARPGDMIVIAQVDVVGPAGKKLLNGTNFTVR